MSLYVVKNREIDGVITEENMKRDKYVVENFQYVY